jgi:hypothetical protein
MTPRHHTSVGRREGTAPALLGREVADGAGAVAEGGIGETTGQPPIGDVGVAVVVDEDVVGLQITVEHAAAVGVADGDGGVGEAAQQLEPPAGRCR